MTEFDRLNRAVSSLEHKVAQLKKNASLRRAQINMKVAGLKEALLDDNLSGQVKGTITRELRSLEKRAKADNRPSLEEIEKELDRIYGDQSLNSTYYFSRKNLKSAAVQRFDGAADLARYIRHILDTTEMELRGRGTHESALDDLEALLMMLEHDSTVAALSLGTEVRRLLRLVRMKSGGSDLGYAYDDVADALVGFAKRVQSMAGSRLDPKMSSKTAAFLRQGDKIQMIPWAEMSLKEVQDAMDDLYGDQSQNSTYYFNKEKKALAQVEAALEGKTAMSLDEALYQMDRLYGDQSKNDTFYPSRRHTPSELVELTAISTNQEGLEDVAVLEGDWATESMDYEALAEGNGNGTSSTT